jgi:hypothetical protein
MREHTPGLCSAQSPREHAVFELLPEVEFYLN